MEKVLESPPGDTPIEKFTVVDKRAVSQPVVEPEEPGMPPEFRHLRNPSVINPGPSRAQRRAHGMRRSHLLAQMAKEARRDGEQQSNAGS